MLHKTSGLLALALAVFSVLFTSPSQAQTASNFKNDVAKSSQSSITEINRKPNLNHSNSSNQGKVTNISQSTPESSSITGKEKQNLRPRVPVFSRIFPGLKQ